MSRWGYGNTENVLCCLTQSGIVWRTRHIFSYANGGGYSWVSPRYHSPYCCLRQSLRSIVLSEYLLDLTITSRKPSPSAPHQFKTGVPLMLFVTDSLFPQLECEWAACTSFVSRFDIIFLWTSHVTNPNVLPFLVLKDRFGLLDAVLLPKLNSESQTNCPLSIY